MQKNEDRNIVFNILNLIYKIVSPVSGILMVVLSLFPNVKPQSIILVSIIYFTTVIILLLSSNWEHIYHSRFLSALKEAGITGVYHNKRANFAQILNALSGESAEIGKVTNVKLLVYYGHDILKSIENSLKNIIADETGSKVRIIISEKDSSYMNDVWKLESVQNDKEQISKIQRKGREQQNEAFEIVKELKSLSKNTKGKFEYKRFTTQARYSIIIINNKWAWWTPYNPGLKVSETVSFVLKNNEKHDDLTVIGQCIGHFNKLWEVLPDPPQDEF